MTDRETILQTLIREKKVDCLEQYLLQTIRKTGQDQTCFTLLELIRVHRLEEEKGLEGLFYRYSDLTLLLDDHAQLRRMVRRAEWWEEYDTSQIICFMKEKGFSWAEAAWAVNACCVDRHKVWELLQDAGSE